MSSTFNVWHARTYSEQYDPDPDLQPLPPVASRAAQQYWHMVADRLRAVMDHPMQYVALQVGTRSAVNVQTYLRDVIGPRIGCKVRTKYEPTAKVVMVWAARKVED